MKRASHGLLTAEKVFDIIALVLFILMAIGFITAGVVLMTLNYALETVQEIVLFSTGTSLLSCGVGFLFCIPLPIVSLNFVKIAMHDLETAQSRQEARKGAILAIVAGVICTGFSIPAGVMMLCMKDSAYQEIEKVVEE